MKEMITSGIMGNHPVLLMFMSLYSDHSHSLSTTGLHLLNGGVRYLPVKLVCSNSDGGSYWCVVSFR